MGAYKFGRDHTAAQKERIDELSSWGDMEDSFSLDCGRYLSNLDDCYLLLLGDNTSTRTLDAAGRHDIERDLPERSNSLRRKLL